MDNQQSFGQQPLPPERDVLGQIMPPQQPVVPPQPPAQPYQPQQPQMQPMQSTAQQVPTEQFAQVPPPQSQPFVGGPMPQQPAASPVQQQWQNPTQPQPMQPFNAEPPKKKRKWMKILGKVFLFFVGLLFIAGIVGYFIFIKKPTVNTSSTTAKLSQYAKGQLTAGNLAKLDKNGLFFDVMYNMAQQQVVHQISERYTLSSATDNNLSNGDHSSGVFDYKTKQLYYVYTTGDPGGSLTISYRCVDGTLYYYTDYLFLPNTWKAEDSTSSSLECKYDTLGAGLAIMDGMNSGGMTPEQAKAFVEHIVAYKGLVKVSDLSLVTHDGKQYVKMVGAVTPVKQSDGTYYGMQCFQWAFNATNLNPHTYPYSSSGASVSGLNFIQYVDPTTGLLAYSEYVITPGLDDNGKPSSATETNPFMLNVFQYAYGGPVPVAELRTAPTTQVPSWPIDKR